MLLLCSQQWQFICIHECVQCVRVCVCASVFVCVCVFMCVCVCWFVCHVSVHLFACVWVYVKLHSNADFESWVCVCVCVCARVCVLIQLVSQLTTNAQHLCPAPPVSVNFTTSCHLQQAEYRDITCDEDGDFTDIQCMRKKCFCVDTETGERLNSRSFPEREMKDFNCSAGMW